MQPLTSEEQELFFRYEAARRRALHLHLESSAGYAVGCALDGTLEQLKALRGRAPLRRNALAMVTTGLVERQAAALRRATRARIAARSVTQEADAVLRALALEGAS